MGSLKVTMLNHNSEIKIENVFMRVISLRENQAGETFSEAEATKPEVDWS